MNIKQFIPKSVNVEQPLESVVAGSGTFKNLLDKVYEGIIYPLTNNAGDIVGGGYETGKVGAEDSIEQMKFERMYAGKPLMDWTCKAFELKFTNVVIKEVIENDYDVSVIDSNGNKIVISKNEDYIDYDDEDYDGFDEAEDLPEDVIIDFDCIDGEVTTRKVKAYLKDSYGHYCSGNDPDPDWSEECDGIHVTNIKWGRAV